MKAVPCLPPRPVPAVPPGRSMSRRASTGPSDSTRARSRKFSCSRTLPGYYKYAWVSYTHEWTYIHWLHKEQETQADFFLD